MVAGPQAVGPSVINRPRHRRSICYMLQPPFFAPRGKFRVLSFSSLSDHPFIEEQAPERGPVLIP